MIDIYKKQNLLTLWLSTFSVVNQSIGMLFKAILFFSWPFLLGIFLAVALPSIPGGHALAPVALIIALVLNIGGIVLVCFSQTTLLRLYAAQIEGQRKSIVQAFIESLLPTIFLIIAGLIVGLLMMLVIVPVVLLVILVGYILHNVSMGAAIIGGALVGIIGFAVIVFVSVRFIFMMHAIAVRDYGPIESIKYSWHLTSGKGIFLALGTWFLTMIFALFPTLLRFAIQFGIPLYAPQLEIANLPWAVLIAIGAALIALVLFFMVCSMVFPLLVFLNIDIYKPVAHTQQPKQVVHTPQMHVEKKRTATPVFEDPADEGIQFNGEETVRLSSEAIQEFTVSSQGHEEHVQKQLHQVYQPQDHEKLAQKGDEDRMPTILFDDTMAQKLEDNRKMFTPQKQEDTDKPDDEQGPQSIKMSK